MKPPLKSGFKTDVNILKFIINLDDGEIFYGLLFQKIEWLKLKANKMQVQNNKTKQKKTPLETHTNTPQ